MNMSKQSSRRPLFEKSLGNESQRYLRNCLSGVSSPKSPKSPLSQAQLKEQNEVVDKIYEKYQSGQNSVVSTSNRRKAAFFQENMSNLDNALSNPHHPGCLNQDFAEYESIRENVMLTAVDQMMNTIDEKISVSKALEQNKYIWAKAMCKSKGIQDIINLFSEKLTNHLQTEFQKNELKIAQFMKETRAPDNTLKSAKMFLDDIKSKDADSIKKIREQYAKSKGSNQAGTNQKYASMYSKSPGKTNQTQQAEQPDVNEIYNDGNVDFHSLAKLVKNKHCLVDVVEKYLIPEDLDSDLEPTGKWIKTMCSEYQLLTFFHKRQALEDIKKKIDEEIDRKRLLRGLAANLKQIGSHVDNLDNTTKFFENIDENQERTTQDPQMALYKILRHVDPIRAEQSMQPRAFQSIYRWAEEKVEDHSQTLNRWHSTWMTNARFEKNIMNEEKWYKIDMKNMMNKYNIILTLQREHSAFYFEAQQQALNELKIRKNAQIEQLQMQMEDQASQELRNQGQVLSENDSFIETFISKQHNFANLKEANRYLETLREKVRSQYYQLKHIRKDYQDLKVDFEMLDRQVEKLTDENLAKDAYFEWIQKITQEGCAQGLPGEYFSPDDKKKLVIIERERMFGQHFSLLKDNGFIEKITQDISASKAFSIAMFSINEILTQIGLFKSNPETIQTQGTKKFKLANKQLFELFCLFNTPVIQDQIKVLNKNKVEFNKFRNAFIEKSSKVEVEEPGVVNNESVKLDERFKKLGQKDMVLSKPLAQQLCSFLMLPDNQIKALSGADNTNTFISCFNEIMDKQACSPPQPNPQKTASFLDAQLHDSIQLSDDKICIDHRRFVLNVFDIQKQYGLDEQKINEQFKRISQFLESVAAANRLLNQQLGLNYNILRQIDPFEINEKQTQVEPKILNQSSSLLNLPEGMEPLAAMVNEEQINLAEKIKEMEAELERAFEENSLLQQQLDEAQQKPETTQMIQNLKSEINHKVAVKTSEKTLELINETGIGDPSYNQLFMNDIIQIGRTLLKSLPEKEASDKKEVSAKVKAMKEKKAQKQRNDLVERLKKELQNMDILKIDISKLDYDKLLDVKIQSWNKQFPTKKEDRLPIFDEHTLGNILQTILYNIFQDINKLKDHAELQEKLGSRAFGFVNSDTKVMQVQTDLTQKKLDKLIKKSPKKQIENLNTSDLNQESAEKSFSARSKKDITMEFNPNVTLEANSRVESLNQKSPSDQKEPSKAQVGKSVPSLDAIVSDANKTEGAQTNGSPKILKEREEQPHGPLEKDLMLHDIYQDLTLDTILQDEGFDMFPAQKPLKANLYNKIKKRLDFIGNANQKSRDRSKSDRQNAPIQKLSRRAMTPGGASKLNTKVFDFKDMENYYEMKQGEAYSIIDQKQMTQGIQNNQFAPGKHKRASTQARIMQMKGKNCQIFDGRARRIQNLKQNQFNNKDKTQITVKINSSRKQSPEESVSRQKDELAEQTCSQPQISNTNDNIMTPMQNQDQSLVSQLENQSQFEKQSTLLKKDFIEQGVSILDAITAEAMGQDLSPINSQKRYIRTNENNSSSGKFQMEQRASLAEWKLKQHNQNSEETRMNDDHTGSITEILQKKEDSNTSSQPQINQTFQTKPDMSRNLQQETGQHSYGIQRHASQGSKESIKSNMQAQSSNVKIVVHKNASSGKFVNVSQPSNQQILQNSPQREGTIEIGGENTHEEASQGLDDDEAEVMQTQNYDENGKEKAHAKLKVVKQGTEKLLELEKKDSTLRNSIQERNHESPFKIRSNRQSTHDEFNSEIGSPQFKKQLLSDPAIQPSSLTMQKVDITPSNLSHVKKCDTGAGPDTQITYNNSPKSSKQHRESGNLNYAQRNNKRGGYKNQTIETDQNVIKQKYYNLNVTSNSRDELSGYSQNLFFSSNSLISPSGFRTQAVDFATYAKNVGTYQVSNEPSMKLLSPKDRENINNKVMGIRSGKGKISLQNAAKYGDVPSDQQHGEISCQTLDQESSIEQQMAENNENLQQVYTYIQKNRSVSSKGVRTPATMKPRLFTGTYRQPSNQGMVIQENLSTKDSGLQLNKVFSKRKSSLHPHLTKNSRLTTAQSPQGSRGFSASSFNVMGRRKDSRKEQKKIRIKATDDGKQPSSLLVGMTLGDDYIPQYTLSRLDLSKSNIQKDLSNKRKYSKGERGVIQHVLEQKEQLLL